MKKTLLTYLFSTVVAVSIAQVPFYNFSVSNNTYADLTNPTSLTNNLTWDDPEVLYIPMGFSFQLFNNTITSVTMINGNLILIDSVSVAQPVLSALNADIADRAYNDNLGPGQTGSLSHIAYQTEGVVGIQITKIELKNVGFYEEIEDDGVSSDYANYQIWFHEGTNDIEFHYGPNSILQDSMCYEDGMGPNVFLISEFNLDTDSLLGHMQVLTGSSSNPTSTLFTDSIDNIPSLTGDIPNGTVYKFSTTPSSIVERHEMNITLYPNPASNFLSVSMTNNDAEIATARIINGIGQTSKIINKNFNSINIKNCKSGIYTIEIITKNGTSYTRRWMKE